MKRNSIPTLVILALAAWVPTAAASQTGGCFVEVTESELAEEPVASFCVEQITEAACDLFAPDAFEWGQGQLCLNRPY